MALIFSSITVYRFIEQNGLNLVDSCIRGFKIDSFLNTKLNTYEQVLSFPSSMLGFVLGFSARMMVDGIKQLSLLPAIIAHHAQLGFKRGLSPFIDPQPVTNASMQHVYRAAWPVTFMGMIIGAIIGIIRNVGLAIRANFYKAIAWAFFDIDDEQLKIADNFHTKSLLRRIAGQIAGLPIHLLLMPLMLIGITSLRLIASSLATLVLNANEAYTLSRPKLMDDLTTWEHILSIPGVILGYALGGVVRALQYLTYDLLYSLMEGLFDGFKYLNDIYPSDASHQVRQVKTLRPANVISYYLLGIPLGFSLKFIANFLSINQKNTLAATSFWHRLLLVDFQIPGGRQSFYSGVIGSALGHVLGLSYFIIGATVRLMLASIDGYALGLMANHDSYHQGTWLHQSLAIPGFYLGLACHKTAHWVSDNSMVSAQKIRNLTLLPYAPPQRMPKTSIYTAVGALLGILLGVIPLVLVSAYRLIVESVKSLAAVPSLITTDAYPLRSGRQAYEQYGFGCIGYGIGLTCLLVKWVLVAVAYVGAVCILAPLKSLTIRMFPRFNAEKNTSLGEYASKFHALHAELDNHQRAFVLKNPKIEPSIWRSEGGKGLHAFIGKTLALNHPSLSEQVLAAALDIMSKNPSTNKEEFNNALVIENADGIKAYVANRLFDRRVS